MEQDDKRKEYQRQYHKEYSKKKKAVKVFFDPKDYVALEKVAQKENKAVATFIREATFAEARHLHLYPQSLENELREGVKNIRSIGNNINQIAKHANEQGYISRENLESVFQYLKNLEEELKGLKDKF